MGFVVFRVVLFYRVASSLFTPLACLCPRGARMVVRCAATCDMYVLLLFQQPSSEILFNPYGEISGVSHCQTQMT